MPEHDPLPTVADARALSLEQKLNALIRAGYQVTIKRGAFGDMLVVIRGNDFNCLRHAGTINEAVVEAWPVEFTDD